MEASGRDCDGGSTAGAAAEAAGRDPFRLDDEAAYAVWRREKLEGHPRTLDECRVILADPAAPTAVEIAAIARACARGNVCLYRSAGGPSDERRARRAVMRLAAACGLVRFERHRSAGGDGLVAIEVTGDSRRSGFIPYSTRPIGWHTDGYYVDGGPERAVRAMVLHCVRPATAGGENALLDPEIAYIRLRDRDPAFVAALMRPGAMTIPPSVEEDGTVRGEASGPVFSVDRATGRLHMRYTARKRWIAWADDPATRAAVAALEAILAEDPLILRVRLAAGEGLLCNNVLHDRSGFTDEAAAPRLLLRLRSHDRLFFRPDAAGRAHEERRPWPISAI